MNLTEYVDSIINGPGGYKAMLDREGGDGSPEEIARFVIRCLANIECEGSAQAVDAIIKRRADKEWDKRIADFNRRRDAGQLAAGEGHPLDLLDLGKPDTTRKAATMDPQNEVRAVHPGAACEARDGFGQVYYVILVPVGAGVREVIGEGPEEADAWGAAAEAIREAQDEADEARFMRGHYL